MKFQEAFTWLKNGKRMAAKSFKGYWCWDAEKKTIIMVTKNNERIDLRKTHDLDFTLGFIFSDSWEFYEGHEDPRQNETNNCSKRTGEYYRETVVGGVPSSDTDDKPITVSDFKQLWDSHAQPGDVDPSTLFKEPISHTYLDEDVYRTLAEKKIEELNHKPKRLVVRPIVVTKTVEGIATPERRLCYFAEEVIDETNPDPQDNTAQSNTHIRNEDPNKLFKEDVNNTPHDVDLYQLMLEKEIESLKSKVEQLTQLDNISDLRKVLDLVHPYISAIEKRDVRPETHGKVQMYHPNTVENLTVVARRILDPKSNA